MPLGPHLSSSWLKWRQSQGLHGVFVKRSLSMQAVPQKTREQHFRGGHRASLPMQGGAAGGRLAAQTAEGRRPAGPADHWPHAGLPGRPQQLLGGKCSSFHIVCSCQCTQLCSSPQITVPDQRRTAEDVFRFSLRPTADLWVHKQGWRRRATWSAVCTASPHPGGAPAGSAQRDGCAPLACL